MREGGKDVPQMDATLLVSQWTGNYGLKATLKQREIEAARTLPANAESVCQDCFGTGFKRVQEGGYFGTKPCDHGASRTAEKMEAAYEAGRAGQSWR